jgi:NAD(P)-dependent dehydrogenase (short-subunit alcohol dehydrogenase family)
VSKRNARERIEMGKLDGKTAIVTGASRGIGRAIAERLAADGAQVVLTARDEALLDQAVKETGGASIAIDLREKESAAKVVDFAIAKFGKVDILVNNAGATRRGEFEDLTDDDFMDGFALKYFGAVRMTRAAWPHLRSARGSLLNISGAGGKTPGRQFAIGGSVNAALLSFTKALAELGLKDGVQVNLVNPGTIRTARFQGRLTALAKEQNLDPKTAEAAYIREQKISRIGEPDDIAALVAFIVSKEGSFMHGSLVDMDGGSTKSI